MIKADSVPNHWFNKNQQNSTYISVILKFNVHEFIWQIFIPKIYSKEE